MPFIHAILYVAHTFQDANTRPHRSRIVTEMKRSIQIEYLPWTVKILICVRSDRSIPQPFNNNMELVWPFCDEWHNIPMDFIRQLVRSTRKRCQHIQTRGGYSHYRLALKAVLTTKSEYQNNRIIFSKPGILTPLPPPKKKYS